MQLIQHRKQALGLIIATLVFILLMAVSFWNKAKDDVRLGIWPLIFLFLAIIAAALLYNLYLKVTDPRISESLITRKVAEERARILNEMNSKEEVKTDEHIELDEIANRIIPKGNLKTAESYTKKLLSNMASEMQVVLGVAYVPKGKGNTFSFIAGFALTDEQKIPDFKQGETLSGQVAQNKEMMVLRDLPERYFNIESGLGSSKPRNLIIAPLVKNDKTIAVIEIATFIDIDTNTELLVKKICSMAADKIAQL
jgi:hypothetical protein